MKPIRYFKAEPSEYARMSVGGKVKSKGKGISGFYLPHRMSIELIGTSTTEQPFAFREISQDKQEVTLQGGFLYRVEDPERVLDTYNLSINPVTKSYLSDDVEKLPEHVLQIAQSSARRMVEGLMLEQLLVMSDEIAGEVSQQVSQSPFIADIGLKVHSLYFQAPVPNPSIADALGAQYREKLLQTSDAAAYERRAQAVAQERAIKENELTNSIEMERLRQELVTLEGDNKMATAKYDADAATLGLEVFGPLDPDKLRALALYELGKNADRIENIAITPELLSAIRQGV